MFNSFKFAFFGTPEFAGIILEKLIDSDIFPDLVVCNPDKPAGRKKIITAPITKIISQKNNIGIWQPEKLILEESKEKFKDFHFAVVAAYAKIIPKDILNLFPCGAIGVHPSFLPKYRGPSPIQSAILNEENETGASLFLMDNKIDHGPILASAKHKIKENEDYEKLEKNLAQLSANLLIKILPKFLANEIEPEIQNEAEATYTKKFTTQDAFIDYDDLKNAQEKSEKLANLLDKKIKALNPEPGTWTIKKIQNESVQQAEIKQERIKILESEIKDDLLKITKIQIDGKKPVEIKYKI